MTVADTRDSVVRALKFVSLVSGVIIVVTAILGGVGGFAVYIAQTKFATLPAAEAFAKDHAEGVRTEMKAADLRQQDGQVALQRQLDRLEQQATETRADIKAILRLVREPR